MKTIQSSFAIALMLGLTVGTASAQVIEGSMTLVPDKKGESSTEVVQTLEKDFNEMKPVDKATATLATLSAHWKITREQMEEFNNGETPDFIEVDAYYPNKHQTAYFNAKGDMVRFVEVDENIALPADIVNKITAVYPDAKITGNKAFIDTSNRKNDYYKVNILNGSKKEKMFFSLNGAMLDKNLNALK